MINSERTSTESARPILVVTLSVPPEKEAEFNAFYHHRFLPAMLADCPEIYSIRRYEESGLGGTLRWINKQFLTIYELESENVLDRVDDLFTRHTVQDLVLEFEQWQANHLRNFSRIAYLNTWSHERRPSDGAFGCRPFAMWSHEMKPEMDEAFQGWYENSYLPLQLADIPGWAACRRYASVGRNPVRRLTVFEAADEFSLNRCVSDLRLDHRVWQNYEWHRRVGQAALWQEAACFKIIYRRPG
jgi:hypothetical protein